MTRFHELEEHITACWQITNDVDVLFEHVTDTPYGKIDQDEIANILLGLKQLYDIRFNRLFDRYEKLLTDQASA